MAKNPAFHGRTKHIDVQYHFTRKLIGDGKIMLKLCGTNEQEADIFTKSFLRLSLNFSGYSWEFVSLNQGGMLVELFKISVMFLGVCSVEFFSLLFLGFLIC